jgi:hypothetical protein
MVNRDNAPITINGRVVQHQLAPDENELLIASKLAKRIYASYRPPDRGLDLIKPPPTGGY